MESVNNNDSLQTTTPNYCRSDVGSDIFLKFSAEINHWNYNHILVKALHIMKSRQKNDLRNVSHWF